MANYRVANNTATLKSTYEPRGPSGRTLIPVSVAWSIYEYFYSHLDGMLVHRNKYRPSKKYKGPKSLLILLKKHYRWFEILFSNERGQLCYYNKWVHEFGLTWSALRNRLLIKRPSESHFLVVSIRQLCVPFSASLLGSCNHGWLSVAFIRIENKA